MVLGQKKFTLILLLFFWVFAEPVTAQFYPVQYRPQVDWQQLSTPHFKIVFPAGEDSAAYKTASLLEKHYPGVQQLTGGHLSNFPVILTNYNDRSNGFVTSLHFRSEIDIPPHKGKLLNPKTGGWLENVVPHELVHALQFNNTGGPGLGQLVNIFSPDLARSMHGASPSGIREGLATYYESHSVAENGGRGNHPYFKNQFNAVFESPMRWSMGQTVHVSDYSRPFNRIYLGGYTFTNWLQERYGQETSRSAINFNIRWPFLGYGIALKHATGKWPAQLYDEFTAYKKRELEQMNSPSGGEQIMPLPIPFDGGDVRRPKWTSDSTLIFHGSFYDANAGFYLYDVADKTARRIIDTRSVSDYNYTLSSDGKSLVYSYYDADLVSPNAFKAALAEADLQAGTSQHVLPDRRFYAPAFSGDSLLFALETFHTGTKLNQIKLTNQSVKLIYSNSDRLLVAVSSHPKKADSLAVVMNKNGTQALWVTSTKQIEEDLSSEPAISFSGGSVYDPVWHPDGNRLLFSADFSGTLQVYEYNLRTNNISQLTNARYNAFEASYSPDGNRIAFIIQKENEQLPAILSRPEFFGKSISTSPSRTPENPDYLSLISDSSWTYSPYSTGASWLKPRTVLPAVEEISGSNQYLLGAGLHSSDLLQQQTYSLELTTAENRLWYDLIYQNRQFFPGVKARVFSEPVFRRFRFDPDDAEPFTQTFLRQERSAALSVPVSLTLEQNVNFTSLFIEPEIRLSQLRYFNRNASDPSDFANATVGNIFTQFNYRLRQNIRDVQPHSGILLYSELEHFFSSGDITLNTNQGGVPLNFAQPTALRGGIIGYISPLQRWNQSLRISVEGITQTNRFFDNQFLVSDGFSEPVFPFSNNLLSLSSRYTIPLVYLDNGGLLLPLYLSNIYLSAFSNTVIDPADTNFLAVSRTVIGGGLRFQFRISNLSVDIGFGIGFEPSRNASNFFIGNF